MSFLSHSKNWITEILYVFSCAALTFCVFLEWAGTPLYAPPKIASELPEETCTKEAYTEPPSPHTPKSERESKPTPPLTMVSKGDDFFTHLPEDVCELIIEHLLHDSPEVISLLIRVRPLYESLENLLSGPFLGKHLLQILKLHLIANTTPPPMSTGVFAHLIGTIQWPKPWMSYLKKRAPQTDYSQKMMDTLENQGLNVSINTVLSHYTKSVHDFGVQLQTPNTWLELLRKSWEVSSELGPFTGHMYVWSEEYRDHPFVLFHPYTFNKIPNFPYPFAHYLFRQEKLSMLENSFIIANPEIGVLRKLYQEVTKNKPDVLQTFLEPSPQRARTSLNWPPQSDFEEDSCDSEDEINVPPFELGVKLISHLEDLWYHWSTSAVTKRGNSDDTAPEIARDDVDNTPNDLDTTFISSDMRQQKLNQAYRFLDTHFEPYPEMKEAVTLILDDFQKSLHVRSALTYHALKYWTFNNAHWCTQSGSEDDAQTDASIIQTGLKDLRLNHDLLCAQVAPVVRFVFDLCKIPLPSTGLMTPAE